MFKTLDVKQQRPGCLRDGNQGDPLTVPAHPWKRFRAVAQGGRPRHRLGNSELGRQSWEARWPQGGVLERSAPRRVRQPSAERPSASAREEAAPGWGGTAQGMDGDTPGLTCREAAPVPTSQGGILSAHRERGACEKDFTPVVGQISSQTNCCFGPTY